MTPSTLAVMVGTRGEDAAGPRVLVDAARAGDERAFGRLVEPQLDRLGTHCYRMLGSWHDAEDALQDTLLRAWRAIGRFDGRSALHTWLHRIATNVCLDQIAGRPRRALPMDLASAGSGPDAEQAWIEPFPMPASGLDDGYAAPAARYEQREAVELSFIAALQSLPGRQRAVLILRDVLGFSARETAGMLDTTTASVNSALQRARAGVEDRLPERSQQETLRALGDARVREVVERFCTAFENDDVDAILGLLTEDAVFAMPPHPGVWRGRDEIGDSWLMPGGPPAGLRYLPATANGQVALGVYRLDPEAGRYAPIALDVLRLRDDGVAEVIAFRTPAVFPALGLPGSLPA